MLCGAFAVMPMHGIDKIELLTSPMAFVLCQRKKEDRIDIHRIKKFQGGVKKKILLSDRHNILTVWKAAFSPLQLKRKIRIEGQKKC